MASRAQSTKYSDSDDDFQDASPPIGQKLVKKDKKIPVGHILASLKWRNTSVVKKVAGII